MFLITYHEMMETAVVVVKSSDAWKYIYIDAVVDNAHSIGSYEPFSRPCTLDMTIYGNHLTGTFTPIKVGPPVYFGGCSCAKVKMSRVVRTMPMLEQVLIHDHLELFENSETNGEKGDGMSFDVYLNAVRQVLVMILHVSTPMVD